jgi:hypothetical protein
MSNSNTDIDEFAVKLAAIVSELPMRKQEFCSISLQPSLRRQTHAFLPARTPPFRQFYLNMTTPTNLPGLCYLDNFIIS